MITYSIKDFFSAKFEKESTALLLESPSFFSEETMVDYVSQLMKYSLQEYLDYLELNPILTDITTRDITQLSSIKDCTTKMCDIMIAKGNRGLSFKEIALLLHADNSYKDNIVALTKYGENQVKTAEQLGLAFYKDELWYLSSIGFIFPTLSEKQQKKFLAINLLRDPFYSRVIISLRRKDTCLKDFMGILSESTQKRRSSSCSKVLSFFFDLCEEEKVGIHKLTN